MRHGATRSWWRLWLKRFNTTVCRRLLKIRFNEAGQSFAELAFVLPVLLLVLAGVFDVGRGVQAYVVVLNASREVAMRGAANNIETATLTQLALDEVDRGGLDSDLAQVTIQYQGRGFPAENHIIVQVDYRMPLILAVLSFDNIRLGAHTEMVVFW
ncbi:MAG: TadE/TadG family type IV pilus assembly protein [Caldilineaceae bacterium]